MIDNHIQNIGNTRHLENVRGGQGPSTEKKASKSRKTRDVEDKFVDPE